MAFADLREASSRTLDFPTEEKTPPWAIDIDRVDLDPDVGRDSPDVHLEPFEIAGLLPDELYRGKTGRFYTDWTEFGFKVDRSGNVLADAPSLSGWKFGTSNPANRRAGDGSPEVLDLLAPIARLLAQAASRRTLSQRGMTSATALLALIVVSGALSAFHHFEFVQFKLAMAEQFAKRDR